MQYPKSGIYLAIPLALAMAALLVQPSAAQTAKKLNCNGCVKSKQIKNGGIKGQDIQAGAVSGDKIAPDAVDGSKIVNGAVTSDKIANGAVASSDVAAESLRATDLSNEPGVEFDNNGNFNISVTTTAVVVKALEVTAPSSGFVTCIASGHADWETNIELALLLGWDDVGGTSTPTAENQVRLLPAGADPRIGISAVKTFQVASGTQTFFLKARCNICADGQMDFGYNASACMFFPTRY